MFLKIRVRLDSRRALRQQKPAGYPLRGWAFAASLCLHSVWLGLLALISTRAVTPRRPIYDEFVRPYEHKIIFYRVPKRTPEVAAREKIGMSPEPRGTELSPQTVIATSPQPVSKQQTIWLPAPKIEIHQDIPVPNIVAKLELPQFEKEKPRTFIPPLQRDLPQRPPSPVPILTAAAPSVSTTAIQTPRLEVKAPVLPPPSPPPASANTGSAGNANVDLAIASVHPSDRIRSDIPDGAHPGQFAKAPEKGEPATGDAAQNSAAVIPNLTIRNERPKSESVPEQKAVKTVLYAERLRNVPLTTFSVPLRPSSRAIPRAIEAQFQGRNVYTMVIPIENMQAYAGDWIVWFAERSQPAGTSVLLRGPVPLRKLEPIEPAQTGFHLARVQIAAVLGTDGRLADTSVLGNPNPALKQRAIEDVMEWEFKPATRDGTAVAVEVVLEIPFNVPAASNEVTGP